MRLEDVSYSNPSMVYFATLCTRDNKNVFPNRELAEAVVESLMWCRYNGWFRIYAYCLMPNHLHLASSPSNDGLLLTDTIGRFKRYTTRASWKFNFTGQLWQRSWYDHIARHDEDLLRICRYILENPLRKQLVESAEEWPYSGMIDTLPI